MNDKTQKELHAEIKKYLIENPIKRGPGCYVLIAQKFGVNNEYVRDIYRKLRAAGLVENVYENPNPEILDVKQHKFIENVAGNDALLQTVVNTRIVTLQDLIAICEIDTNIWSIDSWECNKWEVGAKNTASKIEVTPLFQVKAKLKRKTLDNDLTLQKELIINEIKNYRSSESLVDKMKVIQKSTNFNNAGRTCALEINIPDLHIGKLAWKDETGDHYDLKIAVERYKDAVRELLSRAPLHAIDKYILVIGNDMLNVDGKHNLTTNGTPQSSDGRFYKMVQVAKNLMIETINTLAEHAEVDVIVVPGNHDNNSMLMLGDILDSWYHNSPDVKVLNEPTQRKYYQYGINGFQYTHGNEEKHSELGMIFAAEKPDLWAATKYRICKVGHFHKNKKIQYVSVDEFQGFQVQILPSLSGSDAWHASKGYNSLKQAKAFLYDKHRGLLAEYTHNI